MSQPILNISINEIKYGLNKIILENIEISIDKVGLYGFFGKNGQGKSTLLKAIAGLKNFEGNITINHQKLLSEDVAFLATEPIIYEYLTAKEFYQFYKKISGRKNSNSTNKMFDIDESILLKSMSTGTLKKAYFNSILQFDDYKIYIFDEPFNGLDIESNYVLIQKINELAKNNIVFISSHIIEIIESYLTKSFYVFNKNIEEISTIDLKSKLMTNG